jgi:hypothetical protein
MKTITEQLKDKMLKGMIMNFKLHGHLAPVMFFVKNGSFDVLPIPSGLLANTEGKEILADIIKFSCSLSDVTVAGIIIEATARKYYPTDEMIEQIKREEFDFSSVTSKREDIILMIFSTPESEEVIAYNVDCDKKKIGKRLPMGEGESYSGIFSDFFSLRKV